jgi:hypothetical protein
MDNFKNRMIKKILSGEIIIFYGKGNEKNANCWSHEYKYMGEKTIDALKKHLNDTKQNGERWAYFKVYHKTIIDIFGDQVDIYHLTPDFENFEVALDCYHFNFKF